MGKAIVKTIVFSIVILLSAAAINWIVIPNNPAAYQAAKLDKLRLLKATPSPKIVLVGGSNLAFSIDSQLLGREFGMPVVNMGLAKSVGLEYLIEEVKPYIGRGDIVIMAPEYELFYDLYYGSDGLIVELQYVPQGFKHFVSLGQYKTFARKFGPIMQAKFTGFVRTGSSSRTDEVYRRDGFNEYGDLTTHLDKKPALETHDLFPDQEPFHHESVATLNDFYSEILAIGARSVLSAPPLLDKEFELHEARIVELYERLEKSLSMPVISNPADYVFGEEAMYDTAYHLLREGRRIRTYQLLDDLERTAGIGYGGVKGDAI